MRILLVEDDNANRAAVTKLLTRAGFDVTAAENGLAAFEILQHDPPEVIVSDLRMPELGGVSFFEQLEEQYPSLCSRTLFVTAVADEAPIRAFLDRTGQPYLTKPFNPPDLIGAIRTLAQRVRSS
jgi:two-component system, sensor histidine kinase and response regulator